MNNNNYAVTTNPVITATGGEGYGVPKGRKTILIAPQNFGYTVTIGCQTVAIETHQKLIKNLASYLEDPAAFEEKWQKKHQLI